MSLTIQELMPAGSQAEKLAKEASGPLDLLRLLLDVRGVRAVLEAVGQDVEGLRAGIPDGEQAAGTEQVLRYAPREAALLGHTRVEPVHLLLALLYADVPGSSRFLQDHGLTLYDLRAYLQSPAARKQVARLQRPPAASLRGAIGISPIFLGLAGLMAVSGGLLFYGLPGPLVTVGTLVFVLSGWLVSLCLHEFGHAVAAFLGGDREVSRAGYLRLDPRRYLDPVFSFLLPMLFVLLGGIGLPGGAVYVRTAALRSRLWATGVAIAGPLASLLFTVALALPFLIARDQTWFSGRGIDFWAALAGLIVLELGALVLTLLPLPPLDGFRIFEPYLPLDLQYAAMRLGTGALLIVFLLLWMTPAGRLLWVVVYHLAALVHVPLGLAVLGLAHMPGMGG